MPHMGDDREMIESFVRKLFLKKIVHAVKCSCFHLDSVSGENDL